MPQLTSSQKAVIIALREENLSFSEIALRVVCAVSTVTRFVHKYERTGSTERESGSGRPRTTSVREDRLLYRASLSDRFQTAVDLQQQLEAADNITISVRTTRRRLQELGLHGRRSIEKLSLSRRNVIARLRWAQVHINWSQDSWDRTIFSDECKFNLHGSDGRLYVRRRTGERMNASCQQLKAPKQAGLMVWGCFSSRGLGRLVFVDNTLNGEQYRTVLEENLLPSIQMMFAENEQFIFQHDNAPCHKARLVSIIVFFRITFLKCKNKYSNLLL